ncbi:MAG: GWxTD domain-containing protein [Bacteroidota bacterium]
MLFFTKHFIRFSILIFALLIVSVSCNPVSNIAGMDISSLYTSNKANNLQVNQLYNINDSVSAITIAIPAGLIKPDAGTRNYSKRGTLKYEIIGEGKRIGLIDSASFSIADTTDYQSYLVHSWTFKAPPGMNYFVKTTYSVPGIQDDFLLLEFFSKKNHSCQSWFRFQTETGEFLSGNITTYVQPLKLVTENALSQTMMVKFYKRNFPTPIPPFVEQYRALFDYTPDSTFYIELKGGKTASFVPAHYGFYFFQPDTSLLQGPTLFIMNSGFPKVTQHSLMLESLRYITSSKEFQHLNSYAVPKIAVDSFWIVNAGRPDLATELIRKYYQRVETANRLYTSFTEGWKTDRGMIYIIMGKPAKVFRSFEQELWIYGEYDDTRALRFYFNKAANPFSNNDYVLARNQNYKTTWYQNVQMWRR